MAHRVHRSPRVRLMSVTPAVLRPYDGGRRQADLKVVSMTGGLLRLSKLLDQGCRVIVVFMTDVGAIFGSAEMLRPVSCHLQPFRFVTLDEDDECRLRAAIQSSSTDNLIGKEWINEYRAKLVRRKARGQRFVIFAALTLAAVCLGGIYINTPEDRAEKHSHPE